MADFALELSFAEEGADAVVDQWRALRFAGIPSQADHLTMTNAPHLSLVVAREIPQAVVDESQEWFAAALPLRIELRGLVTFGAGARVTLAHLAEPSREVADVVTRLRALTPALRHDVWTPHVTLGRRIPRERLGEAIAAVDGTCPGPRLTNLTATRLRWWRPDVGSIDVLAAV